MKVEVVWGKGERTRLVDKGQGFAWQENKAAVVMDAVHSKN